jgi:anti-sigma factor RsiW
MKNDHLTEEEIIDALLLDSESLDSESLDSGSEDPESRERSQHLSACPACSAEFESLRAVIGDLRMAAIASAEQHRRVAVMPAPSHRMPRVMWAWLAVAALICVVGPIAVRHRPARVAAVSAPAQQLQGAVSDEQLLSDIQDDLSSAVPRPMLPLDASVASSEPAISTYSSADSATYSATYDAKEKE